MDVLHVWLVVG